MSSTIQYTASGLVLTATTSSVASTSGALTAAYAQPVASAASSVSPDWWHQPDAMIAVVAAFLVGVAVGYAVGSRRGDSAAAPRAT